MASNGGHFNHTVENGYIPIEPFLTVVKGLIDRQQAQYLEEEASSGAEKHMSPMDQLSVRSGVSRRGLNRIWNEAKWVQIHTADRILCALYATHLWHEPPLDEWYWKVNVDCPPRIRSAA